MDDYVVEKDLVANSYAQKDGEDTSHRLEIN